jgi:HlyD family secretion protein
MRAASFALAGLLLLTFSGCTPQEATAGVAQPAGGPLVVRTGALEAHLLLTGELQAVNSEKIHVPRTPSWRMPIRWLEEDGALVTQGQKVLELDNVQFTGELAQQELAESRALSDLERKRADLQVSVGEKEFALEESRITFEKARLRAAVPESLRALRAHQEDQLALARAETEFAKAQESLDSALESSAAELTELQVALTKSREEVQSTREAISALSVTAPTDGILVVAENRQEGRKYQVGDNVWVGLAVMRIPDLSAMKVVAQLSDVDDGRIAPGMRVNSTLDIDPDRSFGGVITEISPVAQEDGEHSIRRAFRVVIVLDDSDPERMRPGMSVRADVQLPAEENTLLVPREALDWSGESPRALLDGGSDVEVELGACSAQECVVLGGLREGDRLRVRDPVSGVSG